MHQRSPETMSTIEAAATDLARLAESGRGIFLEHPDAEALSRYVTNLLIPPLQTAVREVSATVLQSHRVRDLGVEPQGEPGIRYAPVIHYTSVRTAFILLRGSLKKKPKASLRLYDSEHTNDPQEGSFLFEALDLPARHRWAAAITPSHAYLTSFLASRGQEELNDNLNFWRSYGRDGQGCSLKVWIPEEMLRRVLYGPEAVVRLRTDLLRLLDAVAPIADLGEGAQRVLRATLWEELGGIRYLYKHIAYSDENECRIVFPREDIDEGNVRFDPRTRPDSLRRYYEHPDLLVTKLFRWSGSSITIGPDTPHKEDLRYSFELIKRRAKLHGLEIKTSRIPYRSI